VQTRLGRDEQIAALYTRHAARLRRAISARARGLDATLVDEACAFAWEKLLRRLDIDVTRYYADRWIYKVALHRARVLGPRGPSRAAVRQPERRRQRPTRTARPRRRHRRDRRRSRRMRDGARGPRRAALARASRALALRPRLSYEQIAKVTGTSYTAVNRWLDRGKKAPRQARAAGIDDLGALR
jgi:hypothetical protein